MTDTIIYEQPLNEIIRVCIRLEQLFQQVDHAIQDKTIPGTQHLINLVINLLHIMDRPDLKSKLAKELSHHQANLVRYTNLPTVDSGKLHDITSQLGQLSSSLIDSSGKIGHRLRDVELIDMLRLHLASPGGGCSFDSPLYYYWLQQPPEERLGTIKQWLDDFAQLRRASSIALDLYRQNAKIEEKTAQNGFYQELLDPQSNLRMLRILVDRSTKAYPEASVGRHFLSVRYFLPDIHTRGEQYNKDVTFQLAYCY